MYNKSIGKVVEKTEIISANLEAITFNSIRKVLPNSTILDVCRKAKYRYRRRIITPVSTVLHMIIAAIWPEESFNAAWQTAWSILRGFIKNWVSSQSLWMAKATANSLWAQENLQVCYAAGS